jgi:KDO2-lipid IV(A) lauroyltransferase
VLKFALLWFVIRVLGRLPLPVLYSIAGAAAGIGYRLSPRTRRAVWDNLRHVIPNARKSDLRRAAKQIFRNVAYYYADLAHLPHMDAKEFVDERLTYHGIDEMMKPALAAGRGVVMISAHFGNPELVCQSMRPLGLQIMAVVEPVEPPALLRLLTRARRSHGVDFQPVGVSSAKKIVQRLRAGGWAVALMGDRDILGPRMLLPFFGVPTWMPTGPMEVALRTGAIIYPSFCVRRKKWNIEATLEEPIEVERTSDFQADVRAAALQYIARLEHWLRREPEQWAVLERIWEPADAGPEPGSVEGSGDAAQVPETPAAASQRSAAPRRETVPPGKPRE